MSIWVQFQVKRFSIIFINSHTLKKGLREKEAGMQMPL